MKKELQDLVNLIDRLASESDAGLAYIAGDEPEVRAAREALALDDLLNMEVLDDENPLP